MSPLPSSGPQTIARIARECGVKRMIHVSAMNAEEDPKPVILENGSKFLSAKWKGSVSTQFPSTFI